MRYEPPRGAIPIDEPPPLAVCGEPVLALEPVVPLVEGLLAVGVPVALLPIVFEVGAPPACGEPAAACVWWCSAGAWVVVGVPV